MKIELDIEEKQINILSALVQSKLSELGDLEDMRIFPENSLDEQFVRYGDLLEIINNASWLFHKDEVPQ